MTIRFLLPVGMLALLLLPSWQTLAAAETPDRSAAILTPKPPETPRINGARVYGERPGRPFLFHVATTGKRPMAFSADGLPQGLKIDPQSGTITGRVNNPGTHVVKVAATNDAGSDSAEIKIVIGPTIALTPPMGWNSW